MDTVIAKLAEERTSEKPADGFFKGPPGSFKLVAPPHPQDKRFKPATDLQVPLSTPRDLLSLPAEEPTPIPAQLVINKMPKAATVENGVDDAQVLARIERMMRAEQRSRDLEEENRVLTRTIARLQAEIDRLKEAAK
jgi:hypothetical protein